VRCEFVFQAPAVNKSEREKEHKKKRQRAAFNIYNSERRKIKRVHFHSSFLSVSLSLARASLSHILMFTLCAGTLGLAFLSLS
jgi:hypothetical protein